MYDLDPRGTVYYNGLQVPVIMSHAESYKWGLGSGHGDPDHWLRAYGKSLDTIREDVAKLMGLSDKPKEEPIQENEYKRGTATYLSANFYSTEFDCDGSACCNKTKVAPELVGYVQKIRSHFGRATIIKSGYRCDTYNKKMSDIGAEYHTQGRAADLYISGVTPLEIAKYAESIGVKGIGLYGSYVHIDTRDSKKFWEGDADKAVDSFVNPAPAPAPTPTPAPSKPKTIEAGSIVSIIDGATYSNGKVISYTIRQREWEVNSINGENALLGRSTDGKYNINSYVNLKYLVLVGAEEEEESAPVVSAPVEQPKSEVPYLIRVTATLLNYRRGPSMNDAVAGTIKNGGVYTIIEEKDGWGKLKSGAGWINLKFVEKV